MNPSEQDRLFKDTLSGEELAAFREASLQAGLASVRRRRLRRRVARLGAFLFAPTVLAALLLSRSPDPAGVTRANEEIKATAGPVKYITDDELLALFPDRPVALLGKSGGRQVLVFLDEAKVEAEEPWL